jgi:hypothetical protein
MKTNFVIVNLILILFLASCQPAAPTVIPTPVGQLETQVAAAIYSDQTATAEVANVRATLTAAVPESSPTPEAAIFDVLIPASGCWVNSEVTVTTGQKVIVSASGIINTWGGKDGSNSDPNGQESICGAIECPVQGVGYGALVGRLEDQKAFFVGTEFEYTATAEGQLYFSVNDWECEDNNGTFILSVTVE